MTSMVKPDWPLKGKKIDLLTHDLPHESSGIEWWYFNCHLTAQLVNEDVTANTKEANVPLPPSNGVHSNGTSTKSSANTPNGDSAGTLCLRKFSLYCCFFAFAKQDGTPSHALHYALVDETQECYLPNSLLDPDFPKFLLEIINQHEKTSTKKTRSDKEPLIGRALQDLLRKNKLPLPDRAFSRKPKIHALPKSSYLHVDYEEAKLYKMPGKKIYQVLGSDPNGAYDFDLNFSPLKEPVRHGNDGIVATETPGEEMFYYFIPRLSVEGSLKVFNKKTKKYESFKVLPNQSTGWYDHEFGGKKPSPKNNGNGTATNAMNDVDTKVAANNTPLAPKASPCTVTSTAIATSVKSNGIGTNEMAVDMQKEDKASKGHVHHAWTWLAAQLTNGWDLTAFEMFSEDEKSKKQRKVILIDPNGKEYRYTDEEVTVHAVSPEDILREAGITSKESFEALRAKQDKDSAPILGFKLSEEESETIFWDKIVREAENRSQTFVSMRTFVKYPTQWRIEVPSIGLQINVKASMPDQEVVTLLTKIAYWEGRCEVSGTLTKPSSQGVVSDLPNLTSFHGLGFVERNGYASMPSLSSFFGTVGEQVRANARYLYPDARHLTDSHACELIAGSDTKHYMRGVDKNIFAKTLLDPVRRIIDRGGKSWRSYGFLACCDVVGGDARMWKDLLAMPEFLHVGSLLVDDIQDESMIRRGGPCAHLEYGEPITINAGTAAYFLFERLITKAAFTDKQLIKMYDLYFACLRGGHAGQGLDIHGLDYMMEKVIKTGDGNLLEERVLGIHRLKTAVPAGSLAQMGAMAGGGTSEQIRAVGYYYESIGVAFQIMDDVLNLTGLYKNEADIQYDSSTTTPNNNANGAASTGKTDVSDKTDDETKGASGQSKKRKIESVVTPETDEQQNNKKKKKKKKTLKVLGEDITCGKVTIVIAKAMQMLTNEADRRKLWQRVSAKPSDPIEVASIIKVLDDLGAIRACRQQAHSLVERAWEQLDAACPDSQAKLMLRAFGWFIVER